MNCFKIVGVLVASLIGCLSNGMAQSPDVTGTWTGMLARVSYVSPPGSMVYTNVPVQITVDSQQGQLFAGTYWHGVRQSADVCTGLVQRNRRPADEYAISFNLGYAVYSGILNPKTKTIIQFSSADGVEEMGNQLAAEHGRLKKITSKP